jgi:hypothetical protein
LDTLADRGPFVVLDLHSYNHRRGAANRGAEGFRGWRRAVDVPLALRVRVTVVEFQLNRVGGRSLDRR